MKSRFPRGGGICDAHPTEMPLPRALSSLNGTAVGCLGCRATYRKRTHGRALPPPHFPHSPHGAAKRVSEERPHTRPHGRLRLRRALECRRERGGRGQAGSCSSWLEARKALGSSGRHGRKASAPPGATLDRQSSCPCCVLPVGGPRPACGASAKHPGAEKTATDGCFK